MKTKSILVASALLAGLFSASAFAADATAAHVTTFEAPAPSKVVGNIQLPQRHEGSTVTLSMTVDANGKASNVRVLSESDQTPYKNLVATVKKWEFTPARKNGKAISTRVELPLQVVEAKNG
ncbi:energy transducer TonB [Oleiharenicola lentus]|uniref:energy transducer TonB n=1 Tax=Oleiharenicola lentus TaxID=2508720 RepID=UPI003F6718BC